MPALDDRRRRVLYRANHRGMKENDVLLGGFARAHLAELSEAEIGALEVLLEEFDADILDWATGRAPLPGHVDGALFAKVMKFKPYA